MPAFISYMRLLLRYWCVHYGHGGEGHRFPFPAIPAAARCSGAAMKPHPSRQHLKTAFRSRLISRP